MQPKPIPALTIQELVQASVSRAKKWHGGSLNAWSLSDWACAALGEAGEVCNVIKKLNRSRDGVVGNTKSADELTDHLADEIADTLIYLTLLAERADIDLEAALIRKFNAVSVRHGFPERLSNGGKHHEL